MADYESQIISKTVSHGGIEKLLANGIQEDHFEDSDNRKVWGFLTKHVTTYKSTPSFDTVKERFPDYKFEIIEEPLDFVTHQFISLIKRRKAVESFRELAKVLDENDPDEISKIDETFFEKAQELSQTVPASNVSKFSNMPERIELYEARKAAGVQLGIPYGIDALDDMTMGLHPHQYVTIAGFTGVGKSTLGLQLAVNHWRAGYTPLIISLEMDEEETYRKLDAMAAGLRQKALKKMELNNVEKESWEELAEKSKRLTNDIIVIDIDDATPERIFAETVRWKPDVVVVDYVQLMLGPKYLKTTWEKVDHCSKALKRQARSLRIPVYGLAQTNAEAAEKGAKLTNLGGAKAIGFHSDLMLGLRQDEEDRAMKKMNVEVGKNRGGELGEFALWWNHEKAEYRQWKATDAFAARDEKDDFDS